MFGLGTQELLIILAIVIVLFGASRLAGLGGAMGSSIRDFRRAVRDVEDVPRQLEAGEPAQDESARRTRAAG